MSREGLFMFLKTLPKLFIFRVHWYKCLFFYISHLLISKSYQHHDVKTYNSLKLLLQKGEYKKAEQMLHIALRQAQTIQNEDGITYVYDVMANLAFEVGEYEKAEVLFKSVMQRILAAGTSQEDMKIIHMSLKMAKIFEFKREFEWVTNSKSHENLYNLYWFCILK